jgi:hypothetical protein
VRQGGQHITHTNEVLVQKKEILMGWPKNPQESHLRGAGSERTNQLWLLLSLALCVVSGIGASYVQTSGGAVEVRDMRWATPSGHFLSALLFKPDSATTEKRAPAVVVSHGWFNNREMQDLNYIELSRRGYVVVSIDMYGHGNSEAVPDHLLRRRAIGMYDAVMLVADLPYVDRKRIGVTGHSNGALAANLAIGIDNLADERLISAVLLVDRDAMYRSPDTDEYVNVYGPRDVGIIHARYDEFFFRSYDEDGMVLTPPRDYVSTENAQSFLYFGASPAPFAEPRQERTVYADTIDGEKATRIIYSLNQIHPWTHFSANAVRDLLHFFNAVFGSPDPILPTAQVWQIRNIFTFAGLVGFVMFLIVFVRTLLNTKLFADIGHIASTAPELDGKAQLAWAWGSLLLSAVISGVTYILMFGMALSLKPDIFPQSPPFFIGVWAAVNGLAAIVIIAINYRLNGRCRQLDLHANGALPGWKNLGRSALLSAVVVCSAFGIVFVIDYFFKTDFRIWVLAVKAFSPDKIAIAGLYLPLFLLYFVANSIAINCFSRFLIRGKEWPNTVAIALFNSLAPILLVLAQYATFFETGYTIDWFPGIAGIWLFPIVVILAVTAIISRKIYRVTSDPYIGGFINAAVVTLISVSNTLTIASG